MTTTFSTTCDKCRRFIVDNQNKDDVLGNGVRFELNSRRVMQYGPAFRQSGDLCRACATVFRQWLMSPEQRVGAVAGASRGSPLSPQEVASLQRDIVICQAPGKTHRLPWYRRIFP